MDPTGPLVLTPLSRTKSELAINRLVSVKSQVINGRSVIRSMTRHRRKQPTKLDIKDSVAQLSVKKLKAVDK